MSENNSIYCPHCGTQNPPVAKFCGRCGQPLPQQKVASNASASSTVPPQPAPTPPRMQSMPTGSHQQSGSSPASGPNSLTIASLVCGIISVVFGLFFGYLFLLISGIVLGVLAIVLSVQAKKKGILGGMQTASLILGIIGICLNAISLIYVIACISYLQQATSSITDAFDYMSTY